MGRWIKHDGAGYPFPREDADGNPIAQPGILARIRCRPRDQVIERNEWHHANWWPRWNWREGGEGPGDIVEYAIK